MMYVTVKFFAGNGWQRRNYPFIVISLGIIFVVTVILLTNSFSILFHCAEMYFDRGNFYDFTSLGNQLFSAISILKLKYSTWL